MTKVKQPSRKQMLGKALNDAIGTGLQPSTDRYFLKTPKPMFLKDQKIVIKGTNIFSSHTTTLSYSATSKEDIVGHLEKFGIDASKI